jgi:hypothetical protein
VYIFDSQKNRSTKQEKNHKLAKVWLSLLGEFYSKMINFLNLP